MTYGLAKGLQICCRGGKSRVLRCAALGLTELDGLYAHQREALEFIDVEAQPETERRLSMLVFSGKHLLEQFRASELQGCGAELFAVYSNETSVDVEAIAEKLKEESDEPLILLTLYASLPKVHEALKLARRDEPNLCFTACCFDEAHNLHTASRRQLWDVVEQNFEEDESGEEQEDREEQEGAEEADGDEREDDKEDEQMLDPEEFASMYPWRLYATATPRPQMKDHPEIYGEFEEDWFRYRYIDLLRDQDPLNPMVKPFDLSISVGGRPEQAEQSAEFFDWVAIIREISWQRDRVRRVMVYLSRAVEGEAQQTRSAEHFASDVHRLWVAALAYLHGKGEALNLVEDDLVVTHANGSMRASDIRRIKDVFNAPVVDTKVHVLCSCQLFAEGITLERVDLTVFADGKKSERDVVQSGMRGLKASAADPEARLRILLLVHLDAVGLADARDAGEVSNRIAEALRSRKKMDRMAAVLAALKEEDESLAEELRELAKRVEKREGVGGGGGGSGSGAASVPPGGGGAGTTGGNSFLSPETQAMLKMGAKVGATALAMSAITRTVGGIGGAARAGGLYSNSGDQGESARSMYEEKSLRSIPVVGQLAGGIIDSGHSMGLLEDFASTNAVQKQTALLRQSNARGFKGGGFFGGMQQLGYDRTSGINIKIDEMRANNASEQSIKAFTRQSELDMTRQQKELLFDRKWDMKKLDTAASADMLRMFGGNMAADQMTIGTSFDEQIDLARQQGPGGKADKQKVAALQRYKATSLMASAAANMGTGAEMSSNAVAIGGVHPGQLDPQDIKNMLEHLKTIADNTEASGGVPLAR